MKDTFYFQFPIICIICLWLVSSLTQAAETLSINGYSLEAGHPSLQQWILPEPDYPATNKPTSCRIELGRKLFFDNRLSGNGDMSCATCHNPELGWSDGLSTATGANGKKLERATPSITNIAYSFLVMWDGRFDSLEAQVTSPFINEDEMNIPLDRVLSLLRDDEQYSEAFACAYPDQGITIETLSKAIASFERTVISEDSKFDRWVRGDQQAMTESQVKGFEVFLNPDKGNCVICHSPPNFSDNGYHNIGLETDTDNPDNGRFDLVPIKLMKGAFKTPTLRDIQSTPPYFHNGLAQSLYNVVEHYRTVDTNSNALSPALKRARITNLERKYIVDFLGALTSMDNLDNHPTNNTARKNPTVFPETQHSESHIAEDTH